MTKTVAKPLYINITRQTVMLLLIANLLKMSKYKLFLLYETFGNDVFLFFDLCKKEGAFQKLTKFKLNRFNKIADSITPVLLGQTKNYMNSLELKAYEQIVPMLLDNKIRIEEDIELD